MWIQRATFGAILEAHRGMCTDTQTGEIEPSGCAICRVAIQHPEMGMELVPDGLTRTLEGKVLDYQGKPYPSQE